ncbi:MAG TPA: glycine zipper 2TM domain-containing protein [Ottowia sp.]|nr:glycine zipper 2TM domain-containing protein [Ottowia sp.]
MRRTFYPFLLASLVAGSSMAVLAQTPSQPTGTPTAVLTPKAQYDAELKQAKTRFNDDQKLCSADPDSAGRMQCKRDAQSEYDKAVAAAKGRMTAAGQPVPAAPACVDCGKVVSVKQIEKKGEGSAVGLIAGGVVGGVLGHQVGGGVGKTLATAAGAAGGAYAGREVEKKVKSKTVWKVDVSYNGGATSSYEFDKNPGYKVGDSVKRSGNSIARP